MGIMYTIFIAIYSALIAYGIKRVNEGDSFGWFYIISNIAFLLMAVIGMIRL